MTPHDPTEARTTWLDQWREEQLEGVILPSDLDYALWLATCAHPDLAREAPDGRIYGLTTRDLESLAWQARQRAHTNLLTSRGRAA